MDRKELLLQQIQDAEERVKQCFEEYRENARRFKSKLDQLELLLDYNDRLNERIRRQNESMFTTIKRFFTSMFRR